MKTDAAYREAMEQEKAKPYDPNLKLVPRLTTTEERKLKEMPCLRLNSPVSMRGWGVG